jgi:hypothetical protein
VFHYALELKHYTADTFFGLLLPALVVHAAEGVDAASRRRRAAIWWVVACAGQWWSMGGLLVAPACAIVLVVTLWRRDGTRAAVRGMAWGVGWLALFALHYYLSLRFTTGSTFLNSVWADWMAPPGAGAIARIGWLADLATPFADKPGGTGLTLVFWALAIGGFLTARHRLLGLVFAAVPVSAAVLAILRIVPIYQRLSLWAVPALYVGVGLALDAGYRRSSSSSPVRRVAPRLIVAILAAVLCVDVGRRFIETFREVRADHNHGLNDRRAMAWLTTQVRPGDAVLTTALAKPAVWWYGGVSLAAPGSTSVPGAPILELAYHAPPCDKRSMQC